MANRLMGIETEYAISAVGDMGRVDQGELVNRLMAAARRNLVHLPDLFSGLYLSNGSRLYVDYGNHPELSTPECTNPWDVVRYILAGERILGDIVQRVEAELPGRELLLFKSNVDYGGQWVTWGCHESYMHRARPYHLSEQIIPHLVTRIVYTGAGGFNSLSQGLEFTISPRVPHLVNVESNNSTSDRGIFHTKDESLSKPGFHRLHVICGESLCSETAMWLKVATTALVVAMAEAGIRPGSDVQLRAPLEAMRKIASDTSCTASVETARGGRASALEIQEHYLSLAEKHSSDRSMPPWADLACRHWRAMLNRLLDAPDSIQSTLDWAIKRALYASYAESKGIRWESLGDWTRVLIDLRQALDSTNQYGTPITTELALGRQSPLRETVRRLAPFFDEKGLSWDSLDSVIRLRKELFEIDIRFGQLSSGGIFASLERDGVLKHRVRGVGSIDEAMTDPPLVGRARIRGETIKRLAGSGNYRCDWQGVIDLSHKRVLDLSEPFETEERWLDSLQAANNGPAVFAESLIRPNAARP